MNYMGLLSSPSLTYVRVITKSVCAKPTFTKLLFVRMMVILSLWLCPSGSPMPHQPSKHLWTKSSSHYYVNVSSSSLTTFWSIARTWSLTSHILNKSFNCYALTNWKLSFPNALLLSPKFTISAMSFRVRVLQLTPPRLNASLNGPNLPHSRAFVASSE